ncbi:molybdopterin converting factor subunit 1 [Marichromatium gracile]|uniref:molybdopterin converting factor subunit 1 n=1 Tax=Marichromatium gracile TaxID=1048 RepID=UPI001F1DD6E9|nr:molybdopterin converting factor subunit 1 [Marichromatium gracile]MCF1183876.1 molybdopterin converting factor subunit 1 [Marichromatium gracile]
MIHVRYFASLRERIGRDEEHIELPAGVDTLGALVAHLSARGTPWREALEATPRLMMARNQTLARAETEISDGDEIGLFPPVTGG